jgi:hydrogenase maturation protease
VRRVVIGLGTTAAGDDGVAAAVLEALGGRVPADVEVRHLDGEPTRLIEAWSGADLAVLVDAARTGAPAGTRHRLELGDLLAAGRGAGPAPAGSTHGLGLADAAALGRALGRLPRRLVVLAVEAADLRPGAPLSPAVAAAVPAVADGVLAELARER